MLQLTEALQLYRNDISMRWIISSGIAVIGVLLIAWYWIVVPTWRIWYRQGLGKRIAIPLVTALNQYYPLLGTTIGLPPGYAAAIQSILKHLDWFDHTADWRLHLLVRLCIKFVAPIVFYGLALATLFPVRISKEAVIVVRTRFHVRLTSSSWYSQLVYRLQCVAQLTLLLMLMYSVAVVMYCVKRRTQGYNDKTLRQVNHLVWKNWKRQARFLWYHYQADDWPSAIRYLALKTEWMPQDAREEKLLMHWIQQCKRSLVELNILNMFVTDLKPFMARLSNLTQQAPHLRRQIVIIRTCAEPLSLEDHQKIFAYQHTIQDSMQQEHFRQSQGQIITRSLSQKLPPALVQHTLLPFARKATVDIHYEPLEDAVYQAPFKHWRYWVFFNSITPLVAKTRALTKYLKRTYSMLEGWGIPHALLLNTKTERLYNNVQVISASFNAGLDMHCMVKDKKTGVQRFQRIMGRVNNPTAAPQPNDSDSEDSDDAVDTEQEDVN